MRVLCPHVSASNISQRYGVHTKCTDANGRSRRPGSWVSSALPTTPCQQHVVDAGIDCRAEEWLPSAVIAGEGVQTRPLRSGTRPQHLTVLTSTDLSRDAGQLCGVSAESSQSVANVVSADEQLGQLSGLHVLRQYVPSTADLLQDQLQQQYATSQFGATSELVMLVHDPEKQLQKSIVRKMRLCDSVQQLAEVIDQHGPEMDFISITSCFTAATQQRQPVQAQQDSNASQQPLQSKTQVHNQQQMGLHAGAQNSTAAAGQLMDADEHKLHQGLEDTSTQRQLICAHLQQEQSNSNPEDAAQNTRCPPKSLYNLLQQQLIPLLQTKLQRSADATGVVLVLYSLAVLGYKHDEGLLADLEQAVAPLIPQLSPRLLSQLLWSLSSLSIQPQQLLMLRILLHSGRLMHQANAQDCAQLIQGLARLQQPPPESWMGVYWSRVSELLQDGSLAPRAFSVMMHSLGKLQLIPPAALLLDLQSESQQALHMLPPAGIVMLANALHMLGVKQPDLSWQYGYLQAVQNVLQDSTARELAVLAVPLMRWRLVPPEDWLQQYLALCQQMLTDMTAQGLAVLGHSLSALRLLPSEQWLVGYLSAAKQQQLASTPAGCSYLICTLGAWRSRQIWTESIALPTQAEVQNIQNRLDPDGNLKSVQAAATAADVSNSQVISSSGCSSGRILALMDVLASQCVQCFLEHGSSFTTEQLGMFCRGLAMFGLQGSQQLCKKLQQVALPVLQPRRRSQQLSQQQQQGRLSRKTATAATLVNILLALAVSCPAAATPKLLRALWAAMQRQAHTIKPAQAATAAWASARLTRRTEQDCTTRTSASKPPGLLADSLLQQVLVEVDSASVRDLKELLIGVRKADWAVEHSTVVAVVNELLKKQRSLLQMQHQQQVSSSVCLGSAETEAEVLEETQQGGLPGQPQQLHSAMACKAINIRCRHFDCSAHWIGSSSNSSSGSSKGARIFGLANYRLKSHLAATGAVAAWSHVLGFRTRSAALHLCSSYLLHSQSNNWCGPAYCASSTGALCNSGNPSSMSWAQMQQQQRKLLGAVAIDVCSIINGHMDSSGYHPRGDKEQVQVPQQLMEFLWSHEDLFWSQLSSHQQQLLLSCWRAGGAAQRAGLTGLR